MKLKDSMIKITTKDQVSGTELSKFPEHLDNLELNLLYAVSVEVFIDFTKVQRKYLLRLCSLFKDSPSLLTIKVKDRYSVPFYLRRISVFEASPILEEEENNPLSTLMNGVLNYVDICDFCSTTPVPELLHFASKLGFGKLAMSCPKDIQRTALLLELVESYCKIQGELK